jgi:orotidine 5'-phosphate decarboxylase subfamily 1
MTIKDRMNSDKFYSSLAKELFGIMDEKNTNLCLAADVKTSQELFDVAEKTGHFICCLKTHVDSLSDWHEDSSNNAIKLKEIANEFDSLIFEDRKFADIGKTVEAQFNCEAYAISNWADLVTVHGVPGPGILDGLNHKENRCKALIVAEMSSKGNLATKECADKCVELAKNHENAIGVISQSRLDDTKPDLIHMTPGVFVVFGKFDTFVSILFGSQVAFRTHFSHNECFTPFLLMV